MKKDPEPTTADAVAMKIEKKWFIIYVVALKIYSVKEFVLKNNMILMLNLNCKRSLSLKQFCPAGQTE